jgi:hypothetical protein
VERELRRRYLAGHKLIWVEGRVIELLGGLLRPALIRLSAITPRPTQRFNRHRLDSSLG